MSGTIDSTGLYTAPPNPPAGNMITITATSGTQTATATLSVVFSDHSLTGPFTFSYSGNDQNGFLAVAGSFQADGAGHIVSGVEDVDNFGTGPSTQSFDFGYVRGGAGRERYGKNKRGIRLRGRTRNGGHVAVRADELPAWLSDAV